MQSPIPLPSTLGKYELLEFLGGGMSHVYRAKDTMIGRTVVVKILTAQADEEARAPARHALGTDLATHQLQIGRAHV